MNDLAYFVNCVAEGKKPNVITPEESMEAVRVCLAAEESVAKNQIVKILR